MGTKLQKYVLYYKPSEGKHGTAKCPVLVKINDREDFNLADLLGKKEKKNATCENKMSDNRRNGIML